MADATPTSNRRAFLGGGALAVVAAAAVISIPTLTMATPTPSLAAWNAALASVARTKAAMEVTSGPSTQAEELYFRLRPKPLTFEDVFMAPTDPADTYEVLHDRRFAMKADYERREALARQQAGCAEAENAWNIACDADSDAVKALLLCPAPDLAAVAYKIELARTECMELEDIAPTLADLRRLSGAAA